MDGRCGKNAGKTFVVNSLFRFLGFLFLFPLPFHFRQKAGCGDNLPRTSSAYFVYGITFIALEKKTFRNKERRASENPVASRKSYDKGQLNFQQSP